MTNNKTTETTARPKTVQLTLEQLQELKNDDGLFHMFIEAMKRTEPKTTGAMTLAVAREMKHQLAELQKLVK